MMKIKTLTALLMSLLTLHSCQLIPEKWPQPGVSHGLARERSERITELSYHLAMDVPRAREAHIKATAHIRFNLSHQNDDLFMDFKADSSQLIRVICNGDTLAPRIVNEHLKLPSSSLKAKNEIDIQFIMGNGPLNRNEEYFYALFVPDRARTAIPCFDQPDIKGEFSVDMTIPAQWKGIANGIQTISQDLKDGRKKVEFAKSVPISTYLWAFAAGSFEYTSTTWKGKTIGLYHMLNDTLKFNRNKTVIFDQTIKSLDWLEDYTNFEYPYEHYNLVVIPSFQFGGMELPGATYYNADLVFLEEHTTPNEELKRANLIAHETAHMWFGDLVTMPWFDEVWLKEVFANFMADKITRPWFPDINHRLRFLLAHFPKAYSVDRSAGTNPISQNLSNLENAGTLYGFIIYNKAPIVMAQLENMIGEDKLQNGIREYISRYAFQNASWDNLIEIIDKLTEQDLKIWSHSWVYEPGRPVIAMNPPGNAEPGWRLKQFAEHPELNESTTFWPQELCCRYDSTRGYLKLYDSVMEADERISAPGTMVFADELGYGLFRMNRDQIKYWLHQTPLLSDPLLRGRSAINLFENFLDGAIAPDDYMQFLLSSLTNENEALLTNLYASQLKTVFWHFVPENERLTSSRFIAKAILPLAENTGNDAIKRNIFRLWMSIALDQNDLKQLTELLMADKTFYGVKLNERDKTDLIAQLAIKEYDGWKNLYNPVMSDVKNTDLKAMMTFILPALSNNPDERDQFWQCLQDINNRSKEKWVQLALNYLHHPLRESHSQSYLRETLEMLEEIQKTGDIFFPMGWLANSLGQHSSAEALQITGQFLNEHPGYPLHLKNKIIQNTDMALRRSTINKTSSSN